MLGRAGRGHLVSVVVLPDMLVLARRLLDDGAAPVDHGGRGKLCLFGMAEIADWLAGLTLRVAG